MVVDTILVTIFCITVYMSLPWVIDLETANCMSGAYSCILHSISFVMHIHLLQFSFLVRPPCVLVSLSLYFLILLLVNLQNCYLLKKKINKPAKLLVFCECLDLLAMLVSNKIMHCEKIYQTCSVNLNKFLLLKHEKGGKESC